MSKKFNEFIQKKGFFFEETCSMMSHTQRVNGRDFLCLMNNIIDCSLEKDDDDKGINYHVIYMPSCPSWARELLTRFLIHKLAFTSSEKFISEALRKTAGDLVIPPGVSGASAKHKRLVHERSRYREFLKLSSEKGITGQRYGRSLCIVRENDIIGRNDDRNPWLQNLYTSRLGDLSKDVVISTSWTAFDIESKIRRIEKENRAIENVFIFHSHNRGTITNSYNIGQLNRLNRLGMGIKNCFVFYISERPFRLFQTQEIKNRLASNLLQSEIRRYDQFDGFTTFTSDEIRTVFHRRIQGSQYIIDSEDRETFTYEIDSYLDELPSNYKLKNLLSLTIDEPLRQSLYDHCPGDFPQIAQEFLHFYKCLWDAQVIADIRNRLEGYSRVAIVVPNCANEQHRRTLISMFRAENRSVRIVDLDTFKNGIPDEMVVFLTFRYTDAHYKTFPNSFDPLPLKANQDGLTVINRLTHNRYYEWNSYFYETALNGVLYSCFRKAFLGWDREEIRRPRLSHIHDATEEAENEAHDYAIERCTITFENGQERYVPSSSRVVYPVDDRYEISNIRELPYENGMRIQLLDVIVQKIKDLLDDRSSVHLNSERVIRSDKVYALTEEEIQSNVELWKILLKRKVDASSVDEVYNQIIPDNEISKNAFRRWLVYDNPMILPRSRRCQNSLLTFLGFSLRGSYHRVILTKKLRRNNDTRLLNAQLESLCRFILPIVNFTQEDYDNLYESHSEILTLLDVNGAEDIGALVELLEIDPQTITSITYDNN